MLDIIFSGGYAPKLSFIGGTSLRILHHIPRFSEELDFDCFDLWQKEFMSLTDRVIKAGISMILSSCQEKQIQILVI